jgi:fructoselysine 3-epimerase
LQTDVGGFRHLKMAIKISCCTLGYARTATLEDSIRRIAAIGYEAVDLFTGAPHLWPSDYSQADRKAVSTLIDKLGLKLTGFAVAGGLLGLQYSFSAHREGLRKVTLQYYKDNIELAHELGAPLFNILTGNVLYGTSREEARKLTMEALEELVVLAEKRKVILGLHPQYIAESPLMLNVDDALEMIKELKSKMVKIIYDTAQQNITYRNFADDIRKAGSNLCYVHGADNDGIRWTHEAIGKGTVDWDGIVRALKEIHYDGYICTQSWSEVPNDVDTVMRDSKTYLDGLLKSAQK